MEEAELRKILELINRAMEEAGRKLEMAILLAEDQETILLDNRDDEDIN